MATQFSAIYNRFLGKITDDMYMELTPQDTLKDLQNLLLDSIEGFEFPRVCLTDYEINVKTVAETELTDSDFMIDKDDTTGTVVIDDSSFTNALTPEEINILALLMKQNWIQRQVSSIEHIRMKYTGPDFKMTSQANHLSKLLNLLSEAQRESFHMQRLYKRRKLTEDGKYVSNWSVLRENSAIR